MAALNQGSRTAGTPRLPLRLLEYMTSGSMGGAEHGILMEAVELLGRGHSLTFAVPKGRKLAAVLCDRGFEVWSPRTYGKIDPVTVGRVARLARRKKIDLIHTHLSTASLLGSLSARLAGVPSVSTVHGLNSAFCYRFSTLVVAVSGAVRSHLVAQGIPESRIRVVHNGVIVDQYLGLPERREARKSLGLEPNAPLLLYAGRFSPEKGVLLLPTILAKVRERVPDARLVAIGDGPLHARMEQEWQDAGLSGCVWMPGYRADTTAFLAAADLLLLPSYKEGLPRILLEGMVAALPAVGTEAGGIPEAIERGKTGEMAPIGDADGLAAACAELLLDGSRRAALGAAARVRGISHFSVVRTVSQLEDVFAEALSMTAGRAPGRSAEGTAQGSTEHSAGRTI
ncbi:MAG: glycosyltransferase [Chloroflexi bacterium]|nr:glycosyltransferase [Chloroflexota bacterium]